MAWRAACTALLAQRASLICGERGQGKRQTFQRGIVGPVGVLDHSPHQLSQLFCTQAGNGLAGGMHSVAGPAADLDLRRDGGAWAGQTELLPAPLPASAVSAAFDIALSSLQVCVGHELPIPHSKAVQKHAHFVAFARLAEH
eukprot:1159239-Pelagomonas_calceolata.AAC.12